MLLVLLDDPPEKKSCENRREVMRGFVEAAVAAIAAVPVPTVCSGVWVFWPPTKPSTDRAREGEGRVTVPKMKGV